MQEMVHGEACHGPDVATRLLQAHAADSVAVVAVAGMCQAAALACEDSKCKLMESAFAKVSLSIIDKKQVSLSATAALCAALEALMTNDDTRPPASQAFMHARVLGTDRGAVPVFLDALQRAEGEPEALYRVISSLQQLCANDEICMRVRFPLPYHACALCCSSMS